MPEATKSWKTTAAAVLLAAGAVCTAGAAMLDGDPSTTPDWAQIGVLAVAAFGLLFAKDADK